MLLRLFDVVLCAKPGTSVFSFKCLLSKIVYYLALSDL